MDSIPKDVIEHYLLPRLDLATLIVSCHVSKLFRKNSTNRFTSIWTNRFRNDIYEAHLEARHELYEIGSLSLFKWFEKFLKFPKFSQATPSHLEAAAQKGHSDFLKAVFADGCPLSSWTNYVITTAAKHGDMNLVLWLKNTAHCPCDEGTAAAVAESGNLEILKQIAPDCKSLLPDGVECSIKRASFKKGHIHILEWLDQKGMKWSRYDIRDAIEPGVIAVVEWLTYRVSWDLKDDDIYYSIGRTTPAMRQWLTDKGYIKPVAASERSESRNYSNYGSQECEEKVISEEMAACRDLLDLQQMHRDGYAVTIDTAAGAIDNKDAVNTLKWIMENAKVDLNAFRQHPFDYDQHVPRVSAIVARRGNVELMELLPSYGVTFDAEDFAAATSAGNLEMCEYLYNNNCPWEFSALADALSSHRYALVLWLAERDAPWISDANIGSWFEYSRNKDFMWRILAKAKAIRSSGRKILRKPKDEAKPKERANGLCLIS